jgi:hypothetical protein
MMPPLCEGRFLSNLCQCNLQSSGQDQLGNLELSRQQEGQIVAFLKTLTDGYTPPSK